MSAGPWREAVRELGANEAAVAALLLLALLVAAAILGPILSPNDLETLDWTHVAAAPAFAHAHWFGTDRLGRDLFVRTLAGARVSMAVGLIAGVVSLVLGMVILYSALLIAMGLLVDLLYAWLNPRVRFQR